jgi:hypothetical protein
MIHITIDDREIQAEHGKTVLEAAFDAGIYIPNLCYHPDLPPLGPVVYAWSKLWECEVSPRPVPRILLMGW